MRFDPDCSLPELVQTVTHVAFEVDDLGAAIAGHEILIEPNSPSPGVRVAFIVDDDAPVEPWRSIARSRPGSRRIRRPELHGFLRASSPESPELQHREDRDDVGHDADQPFARDRERLRPDQQEHATGDNPGDVGARDDERPSPPDRRLTRQQHEPAREKQQREAEPGQQGRTIQPHGHADPCISGDQCRPGDA